MNLTVLSSNLQVNLVVCLNGSEVSRTRTLAADETPGHFDLTKRARGMFGHNGRVSLSTIVIKYYVLSNITRPPGMGACPHPMGGLGGLWNGPPSLEKNQNFTSSWDVIRRYLLDLIIFF